MADDDLLPDAFVQAFRDYEIDGVPASGAYKPLKATVRALGRLIQSVISTSGAALLRYETVALMNADTAQAAGKLAYVYLNNGSTSDASNKVYQWSGSAWVAAPWYFTAVAAVVQPLVDAAAASASAAAASAASISTFALLLAFLTGKFPTGYSSRSGVVWAILDSAKRKLKYVTTAGVSVSNLPEVFNRAVTFASTVTFSGVVQLLSLKLGDNTLNYLSGYTRAGWIYARLDNAKRILFGLKKNGTVWAFGKQLATIADISNATPGPTYIPAALKPPSLVADAYGDSLTAGAGGTPYVSQLATLIGTGIAVTNYGIGGQKSTQIAMRMGAVQTFLTVSGNSLPAGGTPVTVTAINGVALAGSATNQDPDYRALSTAADNTGRTLTGYLCGRHGSWARTATGGPPSTTETYTWTSDAGETAVACPAGSLFVPDNAANAKQRELWICVGRNNYNQPAQVLSDAAAMIAFGSRVYKRVLLFGVLNGNYASEYVGGSAWTVIRQLNFDLRKAHPKYFATDAKGRDLREYLVSTYDPAISQDVTDYGNDVPPSSKRFDNIHQNTAGYGSWATLGFGFRTLTFLE